MRFAWARRRWKWVAAGITVAVLPVASLGYLNARRGEQLRRLGSISGAVRPWPPAASLAGRFGVRPSSLPWLFWEVDIPKPVRIFLGGFCAMSPNEDDFDIRTAVRVLNEAGGANAVEFSVIGLVDGSEELIRPLGELEGLEDLGLEYFDFLDEDGLAAVVELRGLRGLVLPVRGCDITGRTIGRLRALPRLERLSLVGCVRQYDETDPAVRRELLPAIASLPSLKELYVLRDVDLHADDIAFLESARPGLKVVEVPTILMPSSFPWGSEGAAR